MRISSIDLFFRREAAGGAGPAVGGAWASLDAVFVVPAVVVVMDGGAAEVVEAGFGVPKLPNRLDAEGVAVVVGAATVVAGMPPEVVSADDFCPMPPKKPDVAAAVAGVAEAEVFPRPPNKLGVGAEVVGIVVEPPKREDDGALVVTAKFGPSNDGALVAVVAELLPKSPGPLVVVWAVLAPKRDGALVVAVEEGPPNSSGVVVAVVEGLETAG